MSVSSKPWTSITHVLETCLYVRDMQKSRDFYQRVFGVKPILQSPRTTAIPFGNTILLLFQLGLTSEDSTTDTGGSIPGHGPTDTILQLLTESFPKDNGQMLKQHFCLAVDSPGTVRQFELELGEKRVKILSTNDWKLGGRSVYFEDPDGHIGEVGSRGIWESYPL